MSSGAWKILPAVGLLVLCGCQTAAPPTAGADTTTTIPALPANYRSAILERAKREFFDPYSIRDAAISNPIPGRSLYGETVSVCIRANAKNRMGGYTGLKTTAYIFRAGQITLTDQEFTGGMCEAATFEPFPELEGKTAISATKPKS